jgi:hypothetical protein
MEQPQTSWLSIIVVLIAFVFFAKFMRYLIRRKKLIQKYGREAGLRILRGAVWQGMSSDELIDSWGRPTNVDHLVYKEKTRETWKYHQTGKNRFKDRVYLENGMVVGWKD